MYHPNWIGIRCSFGLNGIIMNNNEDIKIFSNYLNTHAYRRPPDHLCSEFLANERPQYLPNGYLQNRKYIGFRYNIFDHMGEISTLRESKHWSFPKCHN